MLDFITVVVTTTTMIIIIFIISFLNNQKITAITCYDSSLVLDREREGGVIIVAFGIS